MTMNKAEAEQLIVDALNDEFDLGDGSDRIDGDDLSEEWVERLQTEVERSGEVALVKACQVWLGGEAGQVITERLRKEMDRVGYDGFCAWDGPLPVGFGGAPLVRVDAYKCNGDEGEGACAFGSSREEAEATLADVLERM